MVAKAFAVASRRNHLGICVAFLCLGLLASVAGASTYFGGYGDGILSLRYNSVDGSLTVESPTGGPTIVRAEIPVSAVMADAPAAPASPPS